MLILLKKTNFNNFKMYGSVRPKELDRQMIKKNNKKNLLIVSNDWTLFFPQKCPVEKSLKMTYLEGNTSVSV